ncbi:MAG: alkene reductase [Rhodothermales bacterium]
MNLLSSHALGPLLLPNRVVLAPLTRSRHPQAIPNNLAPTYYAQRASAGLLIAEATQVDPRGQGYPDTPGIHSEAQVEAWREVTDLVHAVGGRIFLQLWHVGRVSHSAYHGGALPVAPSAIPAQGKVMLPDFSMTEFETPHALTTDEIADVVAQFRHGAELAQEAGFDGVEIHGANGYLIEQFLSTSSNQRTDAYGGSAENRVRFLREVTAAVLEVWPTERVGVRFSFGQGSNGVTDANPTETFGLAARAMDEAGLAYIHAVRPNAQMGTAGGDTPDVLRIVRDNYDGTLIANGGYDRAEGEQAVADGRADLIAYGRPFLANPDLPIRFAAQAAGLDAPLNEPNQATFYGGGPEGYTDYPIWPAEQTELEPA